MDELGNAAALRVARGTFSPRAAAAAVGVDDVPRATVGSVGVPRAAVGVDDAPSAAAEASSVELPKQWIVVRTDLGWPLGPLIAQACHASVAALWESREPPPALL